jgi:hypothetical protein
MNQQSTKNLNTTVNGYLESRRRIEEATGKKMFQAIKIVPAPHMNTAVIWSSITQLHYEDLYEIGLHLSTLKNLLPKVPFDNR